MKSKLNHIAIILDGNRRYANKLGLPPWEGHRRGAKKVEELLNWIVEFDIKELTLYCFSIENFNRSKLEIEYILNLFRSYLKKLYSDKRVKDNKIKINFIGNLNLFPEDIQYQMNEITKKTRHYNKYILNLAFGYSGRTEIVEGIKKVIKDLKEGNIDNIDENKFKEYLYLSSYPDLLIRTGGEKRISNFLLYQVAYTEFVFLDKLWPEFTKEDFKRCIEEFYKRERRFGK